MEFGIFGGQFVDKEVLKAIKEVEDAYNKYKDDPEFLNEYRHLLKVYANRPSPLYFAKNMTEDLKGPQIYLKREDLNFTGSHKINNVLGQALLAQKMGKKKLIAETGAGQHGVAVATVAALLKLECTIYMGAIDIEKQALNVYKMRMLGASVEAIDFGTQTLKDAVDGALIAFSKTHQTSFYVIGSVVGPHPYPMMVRDFQKVIGEEIRVQLKALTGKDKPDMMIACVGGGSNAIGSFYEFIKDQDVKLVGVEAGGLGLDTGKHAATMTLGETAVLHGMKSKFLLDEDGEVSEVYSISAGLDYPGVGPEHALLGDLKRIEYTYATDEEAINAFLYLSRMEGIIPAIESSHAVSEALKRAKTMKKNEVLVVTISGRGDKDVKQIARHLGHEIVD